MKRNILHSILLISLCIGVAKAQSLDGSRAGDGDSKRTTARAVADERDSKRTTTSAVADERETYSTNGWNLVWNDEFDGDDPFGHLANWVQEEGFVRSKEPQFYTTNRVENLRVEDGCLVFMAAEASIGVMGLKYKWKNQTTNRVEEGKSRSGGANFKFNLFSINLGMTFYL